MIKDKVHSFKCLVEIRIERKESLRYIYSVKVRYIRRDNKEERDKCVSHVFPKVQS